MEQAPRARARKRDEAGEKAVLKTETPNHRIKTVWEPEEVKAGDQAKAPAGVRAKDQARVPVEALEEVPDKAEVDGLNKF